jgi:cell division septation protein DedD
LAYTERVQSSVKERLTGALILIVALVIVVPELFSGRPKQPPTTDAPDAQSADAGAPLRSYTMELGDKQSGQTGQSAQAPEPIPIDARKPPVEDAKQAAVTAPAAVVSPPPVLPEPALPVAKPAQTSKPEAVPPAVKPAEKPPAAKPPTAKLPTTTPAAQSHGWWVQLGSFAARANADRLVGTLSSAGYSVRVSPSTKSGKELYRVLAGPTEDRAAAVALQARLTAAGHKGTLVAP